MLVTDTRQIGNRLLILRKRSGLTQAEVAEVAGLSDRAYADIERGSVNMRVETTLRICQALRITPDEILTTENTSLVSRQEELLERLDKCLPREKETALALLETYLRSRRERKRTVRRPPDGPFFYCACRGENEETRMGLLAVLNIRFLRASACRLSIGQSAEVVKTAARRAPCRRTGRKG